ncbi:MAG: hypothetical protein IJ542_02600 [Clostridia bacterium]|nr:hypothetical protein [Clostridia bacterium]
MSKTARIVISIIVLGVVAAAIAIFFPTLKNLASGAQLYTASEVQQAHDDGYEEAKTNENAYKQLINELNTTINTLQSTVERLTVEKDALAASDSSKSQTISEKEQTIETLQAQITQLQSQIAQLQAQITSYEEIIESLRKSEQIKITFVDSDDSLIDIKYVDSDETVSIEDPASNEHKQFYRWLNNGVAVDLTNATFNTDTTLKAQYKYLVYLDLSISNNNEYSYGSTYHQTMMVVEGTDLDLTEFVPAIGSIGYYDNGTRAVKVREYSFYEDFTSQNVTNIDDISHVTVDEPKYIKQQIYSLRGVQFVKYLDRATTPETLALVGSVTFYEPDGTIVVPEVLSDCNAYKELDVVTNGAEYDVSYAIDGVTNHYNENGIQDINAYHPTKGYVLILAYYAAEIDYGR